MHQRPQDSQLQLLLCLIHREVFPQLSNIISPVSTHTLSPSHPSRFLLPCVLKDTVRRSLIWLITKIFYKSLPSWRLPLWVPCTPFLLQATSPYVSLQICQCLAQLWYLTQFHDARSEQHDVRGLAPELFHVTWEPSLKGPWHVEPLFSHATFK